MHLGKATDYVDNVRLVYAFINAVPDKNASYFVTRLFYFFVLASCWNGNKAKNEEVYDNHD